MKKSKIVSLVEEKLKKLTGEFSSKRIAQEILEEHPESELGVPMQYIAQIAYKMHTAEKDPNVSEEKVDFDEVEDKCKWSVKDGVYIWESKKAGKISLPVSEMDEIFWEYSQHGLDLTKRKVRTKHNLSIAQFNSIKATLELYKDSDIFSPYTWDNTAEDDRQEMVRSKMEMKSKRQDEIVEDEANRERIRSYKKVIKADIKRRYMQDEFLEQLNALLPSRKKVVQNVLPEEECSVDEVAVSVADLHIGADVDCLKISRKYDKNILEGYLKTVAEEVNRKKAKKVTVLILGDLIESFSGLNHMDSFKSMDKSLLSANLIVECDRILGNFFNSINNLKNIKIVGGNHDRAAASKKEDGDPTIAAIIAYLLKKEFAGVYEIEYDHLVLSHDMGENTKIIISHGDNQVLRKKSQTSLLDGKVMEYGDPNKFNLILTGHWHSRRVNEDASYMRWYSTPSIFSGNSYSERNGWNANPGYFIITEDRNTKLPIVEDRPL